MEPHKIDSFIKTSLHRFLKPKQCKWDNCGQMFYNDYECYTHLKEVHSPKKHVKCKWEDCNFSSSNLNNNLNHAKRHYDLVQGICISCKSSFKWSFDLRRHNKNIHNDRSSKSLKSVHLFGMKIIVSQQNQNKVDNANIAFLLN